MFLTKVTFKNGDTLSRLVDHDGLERRKKEFRNILSMEYIVECGGDRFLALDGNTFIMSLEWEPI